MMADNLNRRAKIVCTLGPTSDTYEQIYALAEAGMDAARLNFSHGTHDEHQERINIVRKVSEDIGRPIAVLQDLQGPKIRVQTFEKGEITLAEGSEFTLTIREITGNEKEVSVSYPSFNKDVKVDDSVLLDDGKLMLVVEKINGTDVHCRVKYGGVLKDHKGLNLPHSILSVDSLTEKDKKDLEFGLKMDVDYVALSFVQRAQDIADIKKIIADSDKNTPVIAKIEKPQAVEDIDAITDLTDVIMIARGDLGVEMHTEEVPPIQKDIIRLCNRKGIPVITATQMLDSMINNPRPTRAEASDVANAVLDGSDAVMLSGETASGEYPVEAVKTMDRIIKLIEQKSEKRWDLLRRNPDMVYSAELSIGYSASHAADLVNAVAIVCLTQSGSTARMISRFRATKPIIIITPQIRTLCRTALLWGVSISYWVEDFQDQVDDAVQMIVKLLEEKGVVNKGDKIVFTAGVPFDKKRRTNMLRIEDV